MLTRLAGRDEGREGDVMGGSTHGDGERVTDSMQTIKLPNGEWRFDENRRLGPAGGFGEVFLGAGPDGEVAVKRLLISAASAAHRELAIGQQLAARNLSYVVPILDAGQDAESDRYFLIMPVCDCSLQDKINDLKGAFDIELFKTSLKAIICGLEEVSDITHRDLKPSNVLLHSGVWKIADFGIAKFMEDSTSLQTVRDSLTPAYAAPEQWTGERASSATDVYAVGCIIHTLVTGSPPFANSDDIRSSHLHAMPTSLAALPPRISAFTSQMLRKIPAARPTLLRCKQVLTDIPLEVKLTSAAMTTFVEAAKMVATEEAAVEAKRQEEESRRRERAEIYSAAKTELESIRVRLFDKICSASESAKIQGECLVVGRATLEFSYIVEELTESVGQSPGVHSWNIVAWSFVNLTCRNDAQRYRWSASFAFADRNDGHGFRWYEIAFWRLGGNGADEPCAIAAHSSDFHYAISNVMHNVNIAYGPFAIDGEDEENFLERWIALVAKAMIGELKRPSNMPIRVWPA